MTVVPFPIRAFLNRHQAVHGDLIVAWSRADDGWLVLSVAAVDADGYVAMVRDLDGRAIGVGRVYETSSLARPWLIVPANRVRAGCADEVIGLLASDLEEIKAALRPWKAVTQ